MIITIDGPAGSGKSTIARRLAEALGLAYLDTGATYRAITLKALSRGVGMEDEAALAELARSTDVKLIPSAEALDVIVDGEEVTRQIRSAEVSDNSHFIARSAAVREVLVRLQRRLGEQLGEFVAEGRDQGSVVFPGADVKFYLDASPEVRARRRYEEIATDGQEARYEDVLRAIIERDRRDRSRAVGPLIRPSGAIEIDTTDKTVEQVTAELLRHVRQGR